MKKGQRSVGVLPWKWLTDSVSCTAVYPEYHEAQCLMEASTKTQGMFWQPPEYNHIPSNSWQFKASVSSSQYHLALGWNIVWLFQSNFWKEPLVLLRTALESLFGISIEKRTGTQRNRTLGSFLALNVADLGSIPSTSPEPHQEWSLKIEPGENPEHCRVRLQTNKTKIKW